MSKLEFDQNQDLRLGGMRLGDFTQGQQSGFYLYDLPSLKRRLKQFQSTLQKNLRQKISIHFAMKANPHPQILTAMKSQGLGVDIVSGGELRRALEVGFLGKDLVFSGVAKTHQEIEMALVKNVGQFNVESPDELKRIGEIAKKIGKPAKVVLRINPNVDAKTHPYISTGIHDNKFGLNEEQYLESLEILKTLDSVSFQGLSAHIGSQILDISVFRESLRFQKQIFEMAKSQGFNLNVFNIGGGLGIDYTKDASSDLDRLDAYAKLIGEEVSDVEALVQFEPGRFLVARFGYLLTKVEYVKTSKIKNFVICNSGMNHLIRPALYGAKHRILPILRRSGSPFLADVVGPVCESSDFFARDLELSPVQMGDWLCVCDAGAYGASMASQYNLFDLPQEVFIEGIGKAIEKNS